MFPEVITNDYPVEFRVGSFTNDLDSLTATAVTDWNSALQTSLNSLTKYALHCCFHDDSSNANVQVWGFSTEDFTRDGGHCSPGAIACVDDDLTPGDREWYTDRRPMYIIVNLDTGASRNVLNHELGHVLAMLNEHYGPNYSCGYPSGTTIMDAPQCGSTTPRPHDEDDFFNLYKPREVPNPTSMAINSSGSVTYS